MIVKKTGNSLIKAAFLPCGLSMALILVGLTFILINTYAWQSRLAHWEGALETTSQLHGIAQQAIHFQDDLPGSAARRLANDLALASSQSNDLIKGVASVSLQVELNSLTQAAARLKENSTEIAPSPIASKAALETFLK